MPTNDVATTIRGLNIKYSSTAGLRPTDGQLNKLSDGWERANQVLRSVVTERLEALITGSPPLRSALEQATIETLQWHFKLPTFAAGGERIDAATWAIWVEAMKDIKTTLAITLAGLSTNGITIADNFATTYNREMNAGVIASGGSMELQQVASVRVRALRTAFGERGSVNVRKEVIKEMSPDAIARRGSNDLSVRLAPYQKGSIHINFVSQLNGGNIKNLHVARTIIHEATHKFVDTRDFAYADDPGYRDLSMAQALCNADSFAYTAVGLYKRCFFRNSEQMEAMGARMDLDC